MGLLVFGTQIHDLRTFDAGTDIYIDIYRYVTFFFFGAALSSTFRFLFAGMRYEEFRAAGEVLGPIYYIVFKVYRYIPIYIPIYGTKSSGQLERS